MPEETVPAETPVHESEPVAENPTSEPTSSIESSTPAAEPTSSPETPAPVVESTSASTEVKPQESTLQSVGDQIAAEVEAAVAAAKTEGESALQTQLAEVKAQADADREAAVAEAHRATGTLLTTLVSRIEPSLAHAQAGLETLKKSSVNPIVSSAIEAFEAHVNVLTEALSEFKTAPGKN